MTWTDQQWAIFCELLDSGWPGDFNPDHADAYRTLLDAADPAATVEALRRLLYRGQRFRPSAAELLGELRADPSQPTFEEAYRLIFGPRGVLSARPTGPQIYRTPGDQPRAVNAAALERAANMHPLVASFVERQGVDRLRELPVEDPDYGEIRRKELRDAWDRHVEAMEGRDVAALASGGREHLGMRKLDPLAALGIEKPAEIEAAS